MASDTKRPRFKIWMDRDTRPFIEANVKAALGALDGLLNDMEPDQQIRIERIDMTDAEVEAMPEWMGP